MKLAISAIIFLLITPILVNAVSVTPAKIILDFQPNFQQTYTFYATNNRDESMILRPHAYGDLEKFIILLTKEPKTLKPGETAEFKFTIKFPSTSPKPGIHEIYFGAGEEPTKRITGGIVALGSVSSLIQVRVPYPGKYARLSMITPTVDVGQTAFFKFVIENLGEERISSAVGTLALQDRDNVLAQTNTRALSIKPQTTIRLPLKLETKGLQGGDYQAIGILDYDGLKATAEDVFRLGDFYINLTNYTSEFEINKINRWDIWIENRWNKEITSFYAEAKIIQDGQEISVGAKTPAISLSPWQTTRLNAFWDTSGFSTGEYKGNLIFYFDGKTQGNPIEIKIVKPKIKLQLPFVSQEFGLTLLLLLIILMVLIVDMIWLIYIAKKKNVKK